jgi:hypothetical protein
LATSKKLCICLRFESVQREIAALHPLHVLLAPLVGGGVYSFLTS